MSETAIIVHSCPTAVCQRVSVFLGNHETDFLPVGKQYCKGGNHSHSMLCLTRLWEGKNRGACGAGSKATRYRRQGYSFSLCALFIWYEMTQKEPLQPFCLLGTCHDASMAKNSVWMVHHCSSYPVHQSKPPQQLPVLCLDALSLSLLWAEKAQVVVADLSHISESLCYLLSSQRPKCPLSSNTRRNVCWCCSLRSLP